MSERKRVCDYTIQQPLLPNMPSKDMVSKPPKNNKVNHPSPQPKLPTPKKEEDVEEKYKSGPVSWIERSFKDN